VVRPEPAQRNRAIDIGTIVRLAGLQTPEDIPAYRFYQRTGLDKLDQIRVLVCDGPSLHALVTTFRLAPFTDLERRTLQRLVPSLRRRLTLERALAASASNRVLLLAALGAIPVPAFVTDAVGRVLEVNAAGQRWLEQEGRAGREALRDATKRREHPRFQVTPVVAAGTPPRRLLVSRAGSDATAQVRSAQASARWCLTQRQSEVVALVVEGLPTRTMAAVLAVSERTIEAHLTAIFERAQVESRAELAAAVWRG
jgi:DNA-binding NarL/FixJ family response regulator